MSYNNFRSAVLLFIGLDRLLCTNVLVSFFSCLMKLHSFASFIACSLLKLIVQLNFPFFGWSCAVNLRLFCLIIFVHCYGFWMWNNVLQATENLGMAMIYTLVTSAQDWLTDRYSQATGIEDDEQEDTEKEEAGLLLLSLFPHNIKHMDNLFFFFWNTTLLVAIYFF